MATAIAVEKSKILVVEDEKGLQETLKDLFVKAGYDVDVADNGAEGLNMFEAEAPDVVITDISMPVMDGYELLQEIKSGPLGDVIPVIVLTARVAEEEKIKGLKFGAVDYITKPFSFAELQLKIRNFLSLTHSIVQKSQSDGEDEQPSQFLRTINNYLDDHMQSGRLELENVAKNFRLSSSGLQKKIRRLTGKSYTQYVREYRLKKAHELLETNQYSIGEVTDLVGFATNSYFSESFRKLFGYVPSKLLS